MQSLALVIALSFLPWAATDATPPPVASPCPYPTPGPPPLESYRNQKASKFFGLLEHNSAESALRRRLASLYKEMGVYTRASEFYGFTADYLEGRSPDVGHRTPLFWSTVCNTSTGKTFAEAIGEEERVREIAHQVATERGRDEFFAGVGLAAAEKALREHGAHCHLLAEWGTALLWHSMVYPDRTTASSRELAIRLLITLAEENISAEGDEGPASVYFLLAQYFTARRDDVSAYVAALIAKERLKGGSVTGSENVESFRNRLDRIIVESARLAAGQRVGKR